MGGRGNYTTPGDASPPLHRRRRPGYQLIELLQAHQILLVVGLQPQPEAGVMAQHPLQPFGAVGSDRRSALEQFIYMFGAKIQSLGQFGAGPAEFLQHLLDQIAGGRDPVGVEAGVGGGGGSLFGVGSGAVFDVG